MVHIVYLSMFSRGTAAVLVTETIHVEVDHRRCMRIHVHYFYMLIIIVIVINTH